MDCDTQFNMREDSFRFDLSIKGKAKCTYYDGIDMDSAIEDIRQKLITSLSWIEDVEISNIDVAIY